MKHSHADHVRQVEELVKASGRPYVAVAEAKHSVFANGDVKPLDLIVYMDIGKNLLALVLPKSRSCPTAKERADLASWEKSFDTTFVGIFVHATDEPTAWRLGQHPGNARPLVEVLKAGGDGEQTGTPPADPAPAATAPAPTPPPAPAAVPDLSAEELSARVESAILEHQEMWARHTEWKVCTRPDDPPLRTTWTDGAGKPHTVAWVWRTAGPKFPDSVFHIALVGPDGHQWGESGQQAERIAREIGAQLAASMFPPRDNPLPPTPTETQTEPVTADPQLPLF